MTTPYATLVAHVHVGGPSGPPTGARLWWLVVATYVAVVAAAVLVGPAVTGGSGRRGRRRVAAGALVLAATAAAASNGAGLGTLALTAAHLSAAAVWLGGLLRLAVRRVQPLRAAVRAFTPWAVTSAGAVAATGVVLAVRDGVG